MDKHSRTAMGRALSAARDRIVFSSYSAMVDGEARLVCPYEAAHRALEDVRKECSRLSREYLADRPK